MKKEVIGKVKKSKVLSIILVLSFFLFTILLFPYISFGDVKVGEVSEKNGLVIQTYNVSIKVKNHVGLEDAVIIYEKANTIYEQPNNETIKLKKGKYNVKIIPASSPIKEIKFDVDIDNDFEGAIAIDDVPETTGPADSVEVYAIDPTALNFTEALVTATAKGTELYKCKEWDFTERKCNGEWIYLMNIVPGEDYSFVLTPEDPAYAELSPQYIIECTENGAPGTCTFSYLATDDTWYEQFRVGKGAVINRLNVSVNSTSIPTNAVITNATVCILAYRDSTLGDDAGDACGIYAGENATGTPTYTVAVPKTQATCLNWTTTVDSPNHVCGDITSWLNSKPDPIASARKLIIIFDGTEQSDNNVYLWIDYMYANITYVLKPNVTLVSPSDGNVTTIKDVNFTCNATDDLQLSNITFYWNYSGSWQANGTVSVSGTSNQTTFERTNLSNGAILWNCYACDNASQCSFAPANWTVIVNYTNQAPQITLNEPANNTQFNNTQDINFNFTATDDQNTTLSCSIYLDGTLNQTNNSVQNNTLTNFLINGISYGSHNWSINCTDGELSNVSETRYFTINDTIAPSIYFNQNTDENGTYRKNWIFINITCSDINKDNVILNWNGNNESLDNNDGDIYWENKTGLNDGIYTFYAFCNDSYSNVNQTEIRNITLDTTAPNIILNYPNNGLVTGNTIITFNCSAYDSIDLANITLWHNATGWQANETKPLTGYSNSTTFTKTFVEGSYLWSCSACDSLGNCNESFVENRTFTIDLDSPIISYVFPTDIDNAYVSRLWTFINVTAYDENGINACILNWDGANETMSKVELDNNNVYCYINKTDVEGNHIYNVYVNDSAGNIAIAGERNITFDITPPIIENVEVTNITRSSAIIKWETNEYANSSINYGINISLGNLISNSTFVLNHSILITNLKLKTLYYFNITSCDFTGNCNTKGIFNFTTYGKSDTGGEFEINETNETNQNITMENITKQNISEESKMEKKEKIVCDIGDIIGICYNVRESESIYFVYNGETHKIIINKINKDNVDITIYSSPINTILKLKEPRFFDITNDNIEDIKVILEEIDYLTKKATIRIEIIECKCPECGEWSKCINNKKTRECYICNKETNFECVSFKEEKTCKEGCKFICWYWLLFIFILLLLTIIFIFWRREEEIDLEKKLKQIEYNLRTNGYDWKIKGISR